MIIDKNFLTEEEIDRVEKALLTTANVPWRLSESTTFNDSYDGYRPITDKTKETFQFVHVLRIDNTIPSDFYDFVNNYIFIKFLSKHNIICNKILRAKMNLVTSIDEDVHQPAHIDEEIPHHVFLYYINDSDGDTILFNEVFGQRPESLTIQERIAPERGKAIFFNGFQYHASSAPRKNKYRAVINIAFI